MGNTSNVLVFKKPSTGCLRFLTRNDTVDEVLTTYRYKTWFNALEWADVNTIIPNPTKTADSPARYFGKENTDQWCYFYEKADLARQQKKWDEVIDYYNAGYEMGFKPLNQFEYLPLLEAYLITGRLEKAMETAKNIPDFNFETNDAFCKLWTTIEDTKNNSSKIQSLNQITQCERIP